MDVVLDPTELRAIKLDELENNADVELEPIELAKIEDELATTEEDEEVV